MKLLKRINNTCVRKGSLDRDPFFVFFDIDHRIESSCAVILPCLFIRAVLFVRQFVTWRTFAIVFVMTGFLGIIVHFFDEFLRAFHESDQLLRYKRNVQPGV